MTIEQDIVDIQQRLDRASAHTEPFYVPATAWTPTLVGSGTAGTFTYGGTTAGTYTRINDTVFLRGRVTISVVTVAPTGNLSIHGLPVTAATVTNGTPGGAQFVYWGLVNIGGGAKVYLAGWVQNGTTQIDLAVSDSAGGAAVFLTGATAGIGANSDLVFVGQYQV